MKKENLSDKLNELDAQPVTPKEFEQVWGFTKEEYLDRMMAHVQKRKAEAAEEEKTGMAELKLEVAELKRAVEMLQDEVERLKKALNSKKSIPTYEEYVSAMQKVMEANEKSTSSKKDGQELLPRIDNLILGMYSKDGKVYVQPLNLAKYKPKGLLSARFDPAAAEDGGLEEIVARARPRRRKK